MTSKFHISELALRSPASWRPTNAVTVTSFTDTERSGGSKPVAETTDGIEVSADMCPPSFLATSCWAS
jgi:hypothetical protein